MRRLRSDRGAALVELALATPLLLVIMIGVVDFARVFYVAQQLTNAARAGAQWGSAIGGFSAPIVKAKAEGASPAISPYTVQDPPTQVCACMTDAGGSTIQACTVACGAGTHMAIFITVTASKTFSTIMSFPGVPNSLTITRGVTLRAQ